MKLFINLLAAFLMTNVLTAQVFEREAPLVDGNYTIDGTAFLEELSNGDLQLRLSNDYNTMSGPDVRLLLNNSLSVTGGVEIVNLTNINHFNGAMTFPVPAGIAIDDYDYVVLYCVSFNQLWASGQFGPTVNVGGGPSCDPSTVNLTSGSFDIDLCPADGVADQLFFENSLGLSAGADYAYLITDDNEILQEVIFNDSYDFEGTSLDRQRVYGLHYSGTLTEMIGQDRMLTTASGCAEHSSSSDFILITKDACYDCLSSSTFTTGSTAVLDICSSDGNPDNIGLFNSLNENPGSNYVYLITDDNEILQEIVSVDNYDFEGSGLDPQRVYGLHFDGILSSAIGQNRLQTTASACFEHSSSSDFLRITKNACPPIFDCMSNGVTSSTTNFDICPTDGGGDVLTFQNTLNESTGIHYAYLLTDANEILEAVIVGDSYDFEGSGLNEQRVYGIHFDGTLIPQIGSARTQTTATACFMHSNTSQFITISKGACPPVFDCLANSTSMDGGLSSVDICPEDGQGDNVSFTNNISTSSGDHYAYLITDANEIVQSVIQSDAYDFEGSGLAEQRVYGIHFDGMLNPQIGVNRMQTTADGCYTHSSSTNFLTINKNACPPPYECLENVTATTGWAASVDVCPTDGTDDKIELKNNINLLAGEHYAFLVTDVNNILQEVVSTDTFNFEGSSFEEQRVYGIHFDGILNPQIGMDRLQTSSSACFTHSSATVFLTIRKNACPPIFECMESIVATTNWASNVDICPSDGVDDKIELRNNINVQAGMHYAYLLTDTFDQLQEVVLSDTFNFEGSSLDIQRIYGIHFDGALNPQIGANRLQTTASGCFLHSDDNLFITVTKDACLSVFECEENLTATDDWATSVEICPTDGLEDIVNFRNNLFVEPGEHYAYLITDANEIVMQMTTDTSFNFEGSPLIEQRVYGIHYDGDLDVKIGEIRTATTASGCFTHSGAAIYLSILKTACRSDFECVESLTASTAWQTNIDICANDGEMDEVFVQNNIEQAPGEHYAFLLTDTFGILQEVFFDSIYNFEGSGLETSRIYGISYAGQLNPIVGEDRKSTTASECFIHSGDNLFITINKTAACITSTNDLEFADLFNVFPNPSNGSINIDFVESDAIQAIYLFGSEGQMIRKISESGSIDIETPGVYFLQAITVSNQVTKKIIVF